MPELLPELLVELVLALLELLEVEADVLEPLAPPPPALLVLDVDVPPEPPVPPLPPHAWAAKHMAPAASAVSKRSCMKWRMDRKGP